MDHKRKVEIFSGGCALCEEVIDVVRQEAGSSSEVIVHNMRDARLSRGLQSWAFDPFRQS
jgi:glutaredoxin 3